MDSGDDFIQDKLLDQATRRTYLITYSQNAESKFPARGRFSNSIVHSFNKAEGKVYVEHCTYCLEPHEKEDEHYHRRLKLS